MTASGHSHDDWAAAGPGPQRSSKRRVLVAAILMRGGWTLLRDSGLVLPEGVPMHIDRNAVARELERAGMLATLHARLSADYGIDHATVEVERAAAADGQLLGERLG